MTIELVFNTVMIAYLLGQTKHKKENSIEVPSMSEVSILNDPNEHLLVDSGARFSMNVNEERVNSQPNMAGNTSAQQ